MILDKINKLFSDGMGKKVYDKALCAIRDFGMYSAIKDGVLVGFSGGADSVMLLCLMKKLSLEEHFSLSAVHVNHGIRGSEATRDETFAKDFAGEIDVDFTALRFDVPSLANESGEGLEEAARNIRYREFAKIISGRDDLSVIATAHNATDNLETMLFNMLRGAGANGLSGIKACRDNIIRPLIFSTKDEIRCALKEANIPYVYDSTNSDSAYTRNYIRNEIIPRLLKITDSPEASATKVSAILRSDSYFIEREADKFLIGYTKPYRIECKALSDLHPALFARVIMKMLPDFSCQLNKHHIDKIFSLICGGSFTISLPAGLTFVSENGYAFIRDRESTPSPTFMQKLTMGINKVDGYDGVIILSDVPCGEIYSNVYKISIQQAINFDIIKGELYARSRTEGDSYASGGMTRRLKKVFNDKSVPPYHRNAIPVICDDKGILCVLGLGVRDEETADKSKKIYVTLAHESEYTRFDSHHRLYKVTEWQK